jgi:hypothetical protein
LAVAGHKSPVDPNEGGQHRAQGSNSGLQLHDRVPTAAGLLRVTAGTGVLQVCDASAVLRAVAGTCRPQVWYCECNEWLDTKAGGVAERALKASSRDPASLRTTYKVRCGRPPPWHLQPPARHVHSTYILVRIARHWSEPRCMVLQVAGSAVGGQRAWLCQVLWCAFSLVPCQGVPFKCLPGACLAP